MSAPKLNQRPTKRYEDGVFVGWQGRVRFPNGTRKACGVHATKRAAQDAMDRAWADHFGKPLRDGKTVGDYAATWTSRHPRSPRTNKTNDHRISRVLDVRVEGTLFRDWPMRDLRRRHIYQLVDAMLRAA